MGSEIDSSVFILIAKLKSGFLIAHEKKRKLCSKTVSGLLSVCGYLRQSELEIAAILVCCF